MIPTKKVEELLQKHKNLETELSTGSIDKRDNTPASQNARLGYSMQNGSGTYDTFFFINNVNSFNIFIKTCSYSYWMIKV